MKRFLVFLIIVVLLGGGAFFLTKKPQVKSFFLSLKERPTESEEASPPVAKPKVEKEVSVAKVEKKIPATKVAPVIRKIDTDGDGIPDTFVMEGEPGSAPAASERISKGFIVAYCYQVCDGDTIWVKLKDGSKDKIRFVGINTPEIAHKEGGKSEPGGEEAKKYVIDKVLKKTVLLDIDDLSPTGYYGRTLALVYLPSTKNKIPRNSLNAKLLQQGYADILYIPPSEFDPRDW